eukprot:scaffold6776_cov37-Cyclotella_meneghiniana.AAC.12
MTGKGRVQGLLLLLADEMEARCVGVSGGAGFWVHGTCFVYSRDQDDSQTITKLLDNQSGRRRATYRWQR